MPLTVKAVETAKPKDKPYKLGDSDGLYVQVLPSGSKSWRANYTVAGKQKTRTYGLFPEVSLARARELHREAKKPAASAAAEPAAPTFAAIAKEWMGKHLPALKNVKHRSQVQGTLERFAYPKLGDRPIDKITRRELADVVEAVLTDPQGNGGDDRLETAHRVAGRITAVFDYAQDKGRIDSHPAGHLSRVLRKRRVKDHFPCIPADEAGELLATILTYPEPVTRAGLLLAAHTFVRPNELRNGHEDQLVEDGGVWVVPEEFVKGEEGDALPHVVPLSKQARALVRQLVGMSGVGLFLESPAAPGRPVSENTLLFALYRLGYRGRMTVHGFRSLASTVLNEKSGFPSDVIERQLHHKETDEVRAAYNRAQYLPQRRELMAWWGDWLDAQLATALSRRAAQSRAGR